MQTSAGAPNTIVIVQTHDAAGNPAPARFEQVIQHRTINTLGSDVMDFLRPLNPRQTAQAGVFTYSDPQRGAGHLYLVGFSPEDARRVQELVHLGEISAAVGPEPMRPADIELGNAVVMRTNNPFILIGAGTIPIAFGLVLLVLAPGAGGNGTVYAVMGALLLLVGIACVVVGAVRMSWWKRARAHARDNGGDLPPDIKGL